MSIIALKLGAQKKTKLHILFLLQTMCLIWFDYDLFNVFFWYIDLYLLDFNQFKLYLVGFQLLIWFDSQGVHLCKNSISPIQPVYTHHLVMVSLPKFPLQQSGLSIGYCPEIQFKIYVLPAAHPQVSSHPCLVLPKSLNLQLNLQFPAIPLVLPKCLNLLQFPAV